MNKIELMGRLVKEIEIKQSKSGNNYGTFTLAVPNKENKEETYFINCIAFSNIADTISKYTEKGNRLIVEGNLKFDKYTDKDGINRTNISVIVNEFYFVDFKRKDD